LRCYTPTVGHAERAAYQPSMGDPLTSHSMTAPPGYDASKFPPFALTADVALLNTDGGQLRVVLVQRRNEPFQGRWALPGGFVDIDEDLESAAIRELVEEAGLRCEKLTQLGAYGDPDRDPRMRVVTVVFWAHLTDLSEPIRGDDAADARIWDMDEVLARPDLLAFDHHQILTDVRSAYEAAT